MTKKLPRKELIPYTCCFITALIGLIFVILGIVADYLPIDSALVKLQSGMSWRYVGLIIIAVALVVFICVVLSFAKKIDRTADKELRRKQRLSAMMSDTLPKEETITVEEGKIVQEEKKPVEEKEPEVKLNPTQPVADKPLDELKVEQPKVEETKVVEEKKEEPAPTPTNNEVK